MTKAPTTRVARSKANKPATAEDGRDKGETPIVSSGNGEEEAAPSDLAHPEEMRATLDVQFSGGSHIAATARCTPAGLVTTGLMVSGILMSIASVIWAARRSPSR